MAEQLLCEIHVGTITEDEVETDPHADCGTFHCRDCTTSCYTCGRHRPSNGIPDPHL